MIDIHSHILPKIDDGAMDLEVSVEMAKLYLKNGYDKVIATPHFFDVMNSKSKEEVLNAKNKLEKRLAEKGIELEILLGNEIYFSYDVLKNIEKENAHKLNNSNYILLEFPSTDIPSYTDEVIFSLQLKGYTPIIAHPERNSKILNNPNILYDLVERGVLGQLNLHSLMGLYGHRSMELAELLIRNNLVHFAATDSHSNGRRSPEVDKALKRLLKIAHKEKYHKIVYKNPEHLIKNERIIPDQPIFIEKKAHFMDKLFTIF